MKKIYLITLLCISDSEEEQSIYAFNKKPDAEAKFNELAKKEIAFAKNEGWAIEKEHNLLTVYNEESYCRNHDILALQEIAVL